MLDKWFQETTDYLKQNQNPNTVKSQINDN